MALTSTLFTGLSGLDVNQTRMNVVGNNIANVNTVAFKASRALFKPQFYVTENGGTPPNGEFGGTNPSQRGLGATVAAIEKDFSAGSIEPTGKAKQEISPEATSAKSKSRSKNWPRCSGRNSSCPVSNPRARAPSR